MITGRYQNRFGFEANWPAAADNFVTGGPSWANVANTPFRQHKNTNFEGGIASPLIAWWPGEIVRPGTVEPELAHIVDIMATCLDVAGVAYPVLQDGSVGSREREACPVALRWGTRPPSEETDDEETQTSQFSFQSRIAKTRR